ncbi:hypothetical protein Tco_0042743, partial [Tanacetum coccineum]
MMNINNNNNNNNNGSITVTLRHHLDPMRPFDITVSPDDTIWQVKRQIQFHPNVVTQAVKLRLHYGGMGVLGNQDTVRDCGIVRNAVVQWSANPFMPINVTNHHDLTQFKVYVEPSTKVTELKDLISVRLSDEYGESPFLYDVYYSGVEFKVDAFALNQTISEFGIYNSDANLDVLLHLSHNSEVDDWTINVRRVDGTNESVQLQVQDLVSRVRNVVQNRLNIPRLGMANLIYEGKRLMANRRLTRYLVQRNGCIYLDDPAIRQANIRIDVKVIPQNWQLYSFNVNRSTTIGELKARIFEAQGTPVVSQRIYQLLTRFDEDSRTLAEYHVNEGCLLYMDYSL